VACPPASAPDSAPPARPAPPCPPLGVLAMRRSSLLAVCGLIATAAFSTPWSRGQEKKPAAVEQTAQAADFAKEIRPLLKTYCFECHSGNKRKAGLNLEQFESGAEALNSPDLWDQVGERLRAKEMPPAKNPQPTQEQREKLLAWVAHVAELQVSCDKLTEEQRQKSTAGYTMSRRLNRTEYNNTLRDLFGVDLQPGDLLPSEGAGGEGFDNSG